MTKRNELADCENCTLNVPGTAYVPTQFPKESNGIAIVGEAPGHREGRTGKPFTGPSGQLLDAVLSASGIDRSECIVTNVVLCRNRENAVPTKLEVRCCADRLRSEIAEASTIIALGGSASSAVNDTEVKITSQRTGPPRTSQVYPSARFISTWHPAYLLRVPDAFPQFVDDIAKVNATITSAWEPPKYFVTDPTNAMQALEELFQGLMKGPQRLVVDIEVGIEKDTDFAHPEQFDMLCVGIGYAKGKVLVIDEESLKNPLVRNGLRVVLEHFNARVSAHNGKFDLAGLKPLGINATLAFDTMLASYALDERSGTHGLKYLAVEKLGAPQYDLELHKWVGKGDSYANIPRDALYKYNAYDVSCTWELQDMQEAELSNSPELLKLMDHLIAASGMLQDVETAGIGVDLVYLGALHTEYEERMEGLKKELNRWVDNPNSPKQVKEALAEMGEHVKSTDVTVLTDLFLGTTKKDLREFCDKMLVWRKQAKLYGTYIKGISSRIYRGRIHPSFLLHGTTTGRLACRNPNLQNVPRDSTIRNMYVASPGNVFVQADYATAELRVVCTLARDEVLRDMLAPDRDIHSEVALRFFGAGFTKDQRVRAKAVVFGLTYGRTAFDLAQEFGMSVKDAQTYLDIWFNTIPATVAWREEIMHHVAEEQEDLVSPFGRHRRFWLITDENIKDVKKEALAFLPQGIASDICLAAATELHWQGLNIRLLVHDSILVECKEEDAAGVSEMMSDVMSQTAKDVFTDFVEFPVEVKIGKSWGEV
jgi:DNA polymerase-1